MGRNDQADVSKDTHPEGAPIRSSRPGYGILLIKDTPHTPLEPKPAGRTPGGLPP